MGKIPVDGLIALFQRMYREHWRYTWGAAEEGDVDCSGAFLYAYRQFGQSIAHGSNAIARKYVKEILPVSKAKPGMAAFKLKKPEQSGYDLPAKYRKGGAAYNGDLSDYYHIGLVDEGGKYVLNAQGEKAGFTRTKLSAWGAVGYLKAVEYKGGDTPMESMVVTASNGKPVAVRKGNSTEAMVIKRLPVGTVVEAFMDIDGWREIICGDVDGWMMSKFLKPVQAEAVTGDGESASPEAYVRTLTVEEYNELGAARDSLEKIAELLTRIVGVG